MKHWPESNPNRPSLKKSEKHKSYCEIGKHIRKEQFGASSEVFAAHIQLCQQCATALAREKSPTKH
jgi:hypothetical protein